MFKEPGGYEPPDLRKYDWTTEKKTADQREL
jgi:hypothetical protein